MKKTLSSLVAFALVINLSACGEQRSRAYKKQRTPTAIKIDKLNLANNELTLRFNYRSYVQKTLENINCDIDFNKGSKFKINKSTSIELGAFATEVLSFSNLSISNAQNIKNTSTIDYTLSCHIYYNQGQEVVSETSALHLIPGEKFTYR